MNRHIIIKSILKKAESMTERELEMILLMMDKIQKGGLYKK